MESTCGWCRCASTTRIPCSPRSSRRRPSLRAEERSTSSSTPPRPPNRPPTPTPPPPPPPRTPRPHASCLLALGGPSQGGPSQALRSTRAAAGPAGAKAQQQAELWGDEQWQLLKKVIEERNPRVIGIDVSRVFASTDGLSAG